MTRSYSYADFKVRHPRVQNLCVSNKTPKDPISVSLNATKITPLSFVALDAASKVDASGVVRMAASVNSSSDMVRAQMPQPLKGERPSCRVFFYLRVFGHLGYSWKSDKCHRLRA